MEDVGRAKARKRSQSLGEKRKAPTEPPTLLDGKASQQEPVYRMIDPIVTTSGQSLPSYTSQQSPLLTVNVGTSLMQFETSERPKAELEFGLPLTSEVIHPSPPSLEQGVDYFKYLTEDTGRPGSMKAIENAASPPAISSQTPPFTTFVTSEIPQLDPLYLPQNSPAAFENLIMPTSEQFRMAYPDLDPTAFELLDYFHAQQSQMRSMSPLNCFRTVALMFSLRSRINLFGVLAWTAWHRGSKNIAQKYFDQASRQLENVSVAKEEVLTALLVLTSAKICSGDTKGWQSYLAWASSTLKRHGGIPSFMQSETSRWLLLHFAYLDILSVSSAITPKLLSATDLEFIFQRPPSSALPEPLCSCCEPLLLRIEQVHELARLMRVAYESGEDLEEMYSTAQVIEEQTWALEPSRDKLSHLGLPEQRLQIRQFDAFKLVTVLHLYQSVLRINAASIPIQVLSRRLLNVIDDLIDTSLAGMFVFPLFVLGVNSANLDMRQRLLNHFDQLFSRIHTRSVQRVKNLLQKVWDLDHAGSRHVDWTQLVDQNFDFRCV